MASDVEESVDVVHGPTGLAFGVGKFGELIGRRSGAFGPGGNSGEGLVGCDSCRQLLAVKSSGPVMGFAGLTNRGVEVLADHEPAVPNLDCPAVEPDRDAAEATSLGRVDSVDRQLDLGRFAVERKPQVAQAVVAAVLLDPVLDALCLVADGGHEPADEREHGADIAAGPGEALPFCEGGVEGAGDHVANADRAVSEGDGGPEGDDAQADTDGPAGTAASQAPAGAGEEQLPDGVGRDIQGEVRGVPIVVRIVEREVDRMGRAGRQQGEQHQQPDDHREAAHSHHRLRRRATSGGDPQ